MKVTNIIYYRRDKIFCHECRFCCSLSICTNKDGLTYFNKSEIKTGMNGTERTGTELNKVLE